MAYLLDNYLHQTKKEYLRQYLTKIIARKIQDNCAAYYFTQRLKEAETLELLEHHYRLTGKFLVLTKVDYKHQKFKLKQA